MCGKPPGYKSESHAPSQIMLTKASVLEVSSSHFDMKTPRLDQADPGAGPSEPRLELVASASWAHALSMTFPGDLLSSHWRARKPIPLSQSLQMTGVLAFLGCEVKAVAPTCSYPSPHHHPCPGGLGHILLWSPHQGSWDASGPHLQS